MMRVQLGKLAAEMCFLCHVFACYSSYYVWCPSADPRSKPSTRIAWASCDDIGWLGDLGAGLGGFFFGSFFLIGLVLPVASSVFIISPTMIVAWPC